MRDYGSRFDKMSDAELEEYCKTARLGEGAVAALAARKLSRPLAPEKKAEPAQGDEPKPKTRYMEV